MKLNELMKNTAAEYIPDEQGAARIMEMSRSRRHGNVRPIAAAALMAALLTLTVSAVGIGAMMRHFGETPIGTTAPKVITERCEGEFSVSYTEAWYSDGRLYLAGELITPEPLDDEARYVFLPHITVNGEDVNSYERMYIYPGGTNSIFIQPLTLADVAEGDTLSLTVSVDAIEDWSMISGEANKSELTVYTGNCYAELEVMAVTPTVVKQIGYSEDALSVDQVSFTSFTVLVEGAGLDDAPVALLMADGSMVFGQADEASVIYRFDETLDPDEAEAIAIADQFYTVQGDDTVYGVNMRKIALK